MKLTELFLAELEREAAGTRRTLERVPEGHNDWKHRRSSRWPAGASSSTLARTAKASSVMDLS